MTSRDILSANIKLFSDSHLFAFVFFACFVYVSVCIYYSNVIPPPVLPSTDCLVVTVCPQGAVSPAGLSVLPHPGRGVSAGEPRHTACPHRAEQVTGDRIPCTV